MSKYLKPIYGPDAVTMRILRIKDDKIWNPLTKALDENTTWADSIITVAINAKTNRFRPEIDAELPMGKYDVLIFTTAAPTIATKTHLAVEWNQSACEFITGQEDR